MPSFAAMKEELKSQITLNKDQIVAGLVGGFTAVVLPTILKVVVDKLENRE